MRSVVELYEFISKADKLFGADEREKIVEKLSISPHAGKKLENFGGIRRLEWVQHGKKPKEHNIYYHAGSKSLPLVIIAIFNKHEKFVLDKIVESLLHKRTNNLGY